MSHSHAACLSQSMVADIRHAVESQFAITEGANPMSKSQRIQFAGRHQSVRFQVEFLTGRGLLSAAALLCLLCSTGCFGFARYSITPDQMPAALCYGGKGVRVPVNYAMLGQVPPRDHIIGGGDVLGVFIRGVLPPDIDVVPITTGQVTLQRDYYPPLGNVETPAVGAPIAVSDNGTLPLPIVGNIPVAGLTVQQATDAIVKQLIETETVKEGREYVYVKLLRIRTKRIVVIREDSPVQNPSFITKESYPYAKRGTGTIVDLPEYENDVLHALGTSGGLPGIDVMDEVWVLRKQMLPAEFQNRFLEPTDEFDPVTMIETPQVTAIAKKLRLWTRPGENTPFNADDIILQDGDVVYLRPRQKDVYFTGGLLPGGSVPLPRDYDIDVLEAVAMANGSAGGFDGTSAGQYRAITGFRSAIPPTRVLVIRKLENGDQCTIRVDLRKAFSDSSERIIIQPGDFVTLQFRPSELAANIALGLVNFNYVIPNN